MKVYGYLAVVLAVVGMFTWTHYVAYRSGQTSITQKLKDDRITVLKDGKAIDDTVRSSSDEELICLLTSCGEGKKRQ